MFYEGTGGAGLYRPPEGYRENLRGLLFEDAARALEAEDHFYARVLSSRLYLYGNSPQIAVKESHAARRIHRRQVEEGWAHDDETAGMAVNHLEACIAAESTTSVGPADLAATEEAYRDTFKVYVPNRATADKLGKAKALYHLSRGEHEKALIATDETFNDDLWPATPKDIDAILLRSVAHHHLRDRASAVESLQFAASSMRHNETSSQLVRALLLAITSVAADLIRDGDCEQWALDCLGGMGIPDRSALSVIGYARNRLSRSHPVDPLLP